MNSLSNFDHCSNPVQAYLEHMTQYAVNHSCINIFTLADQSIITLPNGQCLIRVFGNTISVRRLNFDYDNISTYKITSVDQAKEMIGIISGVCFEHGCNRKESDETAYLICKLLSKTYSLDC